MKQPLGVALRAARGRRDTCTACRSWSGPRIVCETRRVFATRPTLRLHGPFGAVLDKKRAERGTWRDGQSTSGPLLMSNWG